VVECKFSFNVHLLLLLLFLLLLLLLLPSAIHSNSLANPTIPNCKNKRMRNISHAATPTESQTITNHLQLPAWRRKRGREKRVEQEANETSKQNINHPKTNHRIEATIPQAAALIKRKVNKNHSQKLASRTWLGAT